MILLIDNYDSFVYNLARYVKELGFNVRLERNDAISLEQIAALAPSHIILSPGPGTPSAAGICIELIQRFAPDIPILGVCLGHQAIGEAFGAKVVQAKQPRHGKASLIEHDSSRIFQDLPKPLQVGRYHSLIVSPLGLPSCLKVTAWSKANEIMALQHQQYPVVGVQFHPESILTEAGHQLLFNFLNLFNSILYKESVR